MKLIAEMTGNAMPVPDDDKEEEKKAMPGMLGLLDLRDIEEDKIDYLPESP